MKVILLLGLISTVFCLLIRDSGELLNCNKEGCQLPDCLCSSVDIPGGIPPEKTPQFVLFTFDDAVTVVNSNFYKDTFYGRYNSNGCPLAATFMISHRYTDYSIVHELHCEGQEIGLHSITHSSNFTYWSQASVETLAKEFVGQRMMIEKYANIPQNQIKGMRMPLMTIRNNQFEMMTDSDILYDFSWGTREYMNPPLWPYTAKYKSIQGCEASGCPDKSFPKIWIMPMIFWNNDNQNHTCSMTDVCVSYNDDDYQLEWFKNEFNRHYRTNRAPFGFHLHSAWLQADPKRHEYYIEFINYLQTLKDVFIVGPSQVIEWIKNPVPVEEMGKEENIHCNHRFSNNCIRKSCEFSHEGSPIWFTSCAEECPDEYPWLENPLGKL